MPRYLPILLVLFTHSIFAHSTRNVPVQYATIQSALNAAHSGDTILVQSGLYKENIFWPNTDSLMLISSAGALNTIIDGQLLGSVVTIANLRSMIDTATLIEGFTIQNGNINGYGGGIYILDASPRLSNLVIKGNSSLSCGGGVAVQNGNPIIENCTIQDNYMGASYGQGGGGVYVDSGNVQIRSTLISQNTSDKIGGGLLISSSQVQLINCLITENRADYGGGVASYSSTIVYAGTKIEANGVLDYTGNFDSGGGIYQSGGKIITLGNLYVENNEAVRGGGIYLDSYDDTLQNVTLIGNRARAYGGGLASLGCQAVISSLLVYRNQVDYSGTDYGGSGIAIFGPPSPQISNCIIAENLSPTGIGVFVGDGNPSFISCQIVSNSILATKVDYPNSFGPSFQSSNIISATTGGSSAIKLVSGAQISLHNSNLEGNGTALINSVNTFFADATHNWWGDSTGPYQSLQNISGKGDSVSSFVNFAPWLVLPDTTAPPIPVQKLRLVSTRENFISLSWESSMIGDLKGYKVFYKTDSSGYPYDANIDVGNVTDFKITGLIAEKKYFIAVIVYDLSGNESWYSNEVFATTNPSSRVETSVALFPNQYELGQNYPNPFNPTTTIRYGLPMQSHLKIKIYNILGQIVADLVNTEQAAGWNQVVWNSNVSSGIYFYRIEATGVGDATKHFIDTKKMLLLK